MTLAWEIMPVATMYMSMRAYVARGLLMADSMYVQVTAIGGFFVQPILLILYR